MARQNEWIFTEEWDEGCREKVAAYGKRPTREIDEIVDQMERYSPYDYCNPCIFETEKEYQSALDARIKKGCEVSYYNK